MYTCTPCPRSTASPPQRRCRGERLNCKGYRLGGWQLSVCEKLAFFNVHLAPAWWNGCLVAPLARVRLLCMQSNLAPLLSSVFVVKTSAKSSAHCQNGFVFICGSVTTSFSSTLWQHLCEQDHDMLGIVKRIALYSSLVPCFCGTISMRRTGFERSVTAAFARGEEKVNHRWRVLIQIIGDL